MSSPGLHINKHWTLFLDRDGVINRRLPGNYVKTPEEFDILPGVPEAISIFSELFGRIVVVSNQQGIGKGIMTENDLNKVTRKMKAIIEEAGGRLDSVLYAPMLAHERHIMRKPRIGMALAARKQFPEIRFNHSFMAGDSLSDMQFGKCLGMKTALIGDASSVAKKFPRLVDYFYPDLISLALMLEKNSEKQEI